MSYKSKFTGSQIDAGIDAAHEALPKSGGVMTGALILNGEPVVDNSPATKKYVDEKIETISLTPGEKGEPGVSVTHSWNGTTLVVTSASGTSSSDLKGEHGEPGNDGEDGFSPTVNVEAISGGNRVTITDADGAKTFDVMNGKDGTGGGSGGSGADGEDGATFTPSVSSDGVLSWTNDKGLTNPDPVNIKGEKGEQGEPGADGASGIDYIVEQGTTNGWLWRKWNSGIAECWIKLTMEGSFTRTWGSLYEAFPFDPVNYPFAFVEVPFEFVTPGNNGVGAWVERNSSDTQSTTLSGTYQLIRPAKDTTEYTLMVSLYVVGKWQ